MKRIIIWTLTCLIFTSGLNSCMVTKTSVGRYNEIEGDKYTYAKGKQVWLFWGLLPARRIKVHIPEHGDCQALT